MGAAAGRLAGRGIAVAILASSLLVAGGSAASAAGSGNLFAVAAGGSRADTEWRTSTYGAGAVYRRTLIHAYATKGEYLLLGSTGVGVGAADIMVWNPGLVTGTTGLESVPAAPSFSCAAQRGTSGIAAQGRITSRTAELAGPDTVPAGGVAGGYAPCWYRAPTTGVYSLVMAGPSGFSSNVEPQPAADLTLTSPRDFDATQGTAVAAWDVTVRDDLANAATTHTGRVFTYLLSLYTGGNGLPVNTATYPVTPDGYRYRVDDRGMDPAGWVQYGTQLGFLDPDGRTPLYHDALAVNSGAPGQLTTIEAGVRFAKPDYPFFLEPPDPVALTAQGIPLTATPPGVAGMTFMGARSGKAVYRSGGVFSFVANVPGVYEIIISRDGVNFDPTAQQNRVLRGLRAAGPQRVTWDGRDNAAGYFPVGPAYAYTVNVHAGEYHLPFIDVENDIKGGPTITLLNPPGGVCPPLAGGCFGAFYDDRGYTTSTGRIVGTAGSVLCGQVPPTVAFSDPVRGFDSRSSQRAFGTPSGGNTNVPCTGSFGDTKGLDIWTYYPSTPNGGSLAVVDSGSLTLTMLPTPNVGSASPGAGQVAGGATLLAGLLLLWTGRRRPRRRVHRTAGRAP